MNFRVFVRTLFLVVIIAAVGFTVYSNMSVFSGNSHAGTETGKIAENTSGNTAGTADGTGLQSGSNENSTDQQSSAGAEPDTKNAASQESSPSRSYVKNAVSIKISATGDVALGQDSRFNNVDSFNYVFDKQKGDYSYFFSKVAGILSQDDLTIANLETTLSTETKTVEKYDVGNNYWFNGNPKYVNILKAGSVEVADLANNHTYDFGQKGYDETREALKAAGVDYFGYSDVLVKEVKGIKIGMVGFNELGNVEQGVDMTAFKKDVVDKIQKLRKECNLVIAEFHWGKEYQYQYNDVQKDLAYLSIDSGADLVIGNHPHVLQPVVEYKGKYIAYSLGNFCFGGNKTPKDYDTAIYQQSFEFDSNKVLQPVAAPTVVPCSVSSANGFNNYRPTVAVEPQIDSILKKLGLTSAAISQNGTGTINKQTEGSTADKQTMVNLSDYVKNIVIDLRYASTNNITGKKVYESDTAYIRKGTADKLDKANQILMKQGYRIKVWDSYRAQKYQQLLYDSAADKTYFMDPKIISNHTRGAAADVTLVDANGKELDMPSDFDEMSDKAWRTYPKATPEQKKNALILQNAMQSCGFLPLKTEWWHFDDSEYKSYAPLLDYQAEK